MIIYKDILRKLKEAGYDTYVIRNKKLLSESTLQHIRQNQPINLKSIDTICNLLDCKIEDIIEFRKD